MTIDPSSSSRSSIIEPRGLEEGSSRLLSELSLSNSGRRLARASEVGVILLGVDIVDSSGELLLTVVELTVRKCWSVARQSLGVIKWGWEVVIICDALYILEVTPRSYLSSLLVPKYRHLG